MQHPTIMSFRCGIPPAGTAALAGETSANNPLPRLEIPRLADPCHDGDESVWGTVGLQVDSFAEDGPTPVDPADLTARLRLAWTDVGLAVMIELLSQVPWVESDEARTGFERDSLELFLRQGSQWRNLVQVVISPGMAPNQMEPRVACWDYRGPPAEWAGLPTGARIVRTRVPGGCRLTALIPWGQLRIIPTAGAEVEFRCNINKILPSRGRRQLTWRTSEGGDFQRLILGDATGKPVRETAWAVRSGADQTAICAVAPLERVGAVLVVEQSGAVLATVQLQRREGRAVAASTLSGLPAGGLRMSIDGVQIGSAQVADAQAEQRRALEIGVTWPSQFGLCARAPAMLTSGLPPLPGIVDLEAARLGGLVRLSAQWFDATGTPVERISRAGRHGAVITLHLRDGQTLTVYQTAFLPAAQIIPAGLLAATVPGLAGSVGCDPQVDDALSWLGHLAGDAFQDPTTASIWCAVREAADDHAALRPRSRDALWWHALRSRLGTATSYRWSRRLPADYDTDPQRRHPAIIYLHGSGGSVPSDYGDPQKRLETAGERDLLGWAAGHPQPFAIYALVASGFWEPHAVADAVARIVQEDRIDPDRIILMGFSMGGIGTWDCAAELPGLWAAAVPIGGRADRAREMARLGRLPVWAFNGDLDQATTLQDARRACDALQAAGGDIRLTVLQGVDHGGSQVATFETPGLWAWLAERRRKAR